MCRKVQPVYPEEARRTGKQGLAVLDAVIAPDGTVKRLQPVSGDELLVKSAEDCRAVVEVRAVPVFGPSDCGGNDDSVEFRLN